MEAIFNNGDYSLLQGKAVLISGSTGMLASYMVFFMVYLNEFHNYNIKILAMYRDITKFNERFGAYADKIIPISHPLDSPIDVDCDYIIHAASLASPQYYTVQPIDVILPNLLGTYNLLELAFRKKARPLYFSSISVYGNFSCGKTIISENDFGSIDPIDPHSCYDESKRAGESLCAAYYRQKNVPSVIARIAHTYGPTMDVVNDPRVFASFVKNATNKENIEIKSDGSAKRSFCYITDATAAYFKLLLNGVPGEAYNVCNTEQTLSIRELGEIISNIAKVDFIFKKRSDDEVYLQDSNADAVIYSSEKLEALGFSFKVDVKQGFTKVLSYLEGERPL